MRPPLTTVEQPIRKMGERSVELLLSLIRGDKAEPTHITLATNLVIRHSTRAWRSPPRAARLLPAGSGRYAAAARPDDCRTTDGTGRAPMLADLPLSELRGYAPDVADPADFDEFWSGQRAAPDPSDNGAPSTRGFLTRGIAVIQGSARRAAELIASAPAQTDCRTS